MVNLTHSKNVTSRDNQQERLKRMNKSIKDTLIAIVLFGFGYILAKWLLDNFIYPNFVVEEWIRRLVITFLTLGICIIPGIIFTRKNKPFTFISEFSLESSETTRQGLDNNNRDKI